MTEPPRKRAERWYRDLALIVLNTLVLFAVLNVLLLGLYRIRDARPAQDNAVVIQYEGIIYDEASLRAIYPDLPLSEVLDMLDETWTRPYVYEAFTQFKERPIEGAYVNVDTAGFRHSRNQRPWPPLPDDVSVFVFGGSTAFGYGLPDAQTLASYLQEMLDDGSDQRVAVYNFGRGDYFSTQERILFEELLRRGTKPDIALFVDGLNDFHFYHDSIFTRRFRDRFEGGPVVRATTPAARLPILRLARSLQLRLGLNRPDPVAAPAQPPTDVEVIVPRVIDRYLANKRMIEATAASYGVRPLFVWQPVPAYRYDLSHHLFAEYRLFDIHPFAQDGYPAAAAAYEAGTMGENFLWAADLQVGLAEPLYVDQAHYTARLTQLLARHIADHMQQSGIVDAP